MMRGVYGKYHAYEFREDVFNPHITVMKVAV